MPTLSEAERRDDIRKLGKIDTHHRFLRDGGVTDGWFDNNAFIILTERAPDGEPLVGVLLKYPYECPVDRTATMQIKYWLANLNRKGELGAAFKANIQAIHDEMAALGVQRVWGAVPKNAAHLTTLLNPIATAAACEKVDGTTVLAEDELTSPYQNFDFFFGDRDVVNGEVQR
jgi:hypothetical protein